MPSAQNVWYEFQLAPWAGAPWSCWWRGFSQASIIPLARESRAVLGRE